MRDFRKLTQPERSEPPAPANVREIEPIGGSEWLLKVDGVLYRRVGAEAAELARMIRDPDVLEPAQSGEAAAT